MALLAQWIVMLVCLVMVVNAILNFRRIRSDRRRTAAQRVPEPPPLISVCVPARNEAHNITALLDSLLRQDYPNFEIVVLDDCSDDGTGELAREYAAKYANITVLSGRPLAPGWIGKPHACLQLSEAARGEYLLFTDADTTWSPDALSKSLRLMRARGADLLSGLPGMKVVGFWERISVPMLGVIGMGLLSFDLLSSPATPWWYAAGSGAFLMFRRSAYDAIGGHWCVRSRIVEDISMVRLTKRAGLRVALADVSDFVQCRMYRNLREVWEGFTKNFHESFPGVMMIGAIAFMLGCFTMPWIWFVFGRSWGWGMMMATVLPLLQIVTTGWIRIAVDHKMKHPDFWGVLMMPLAGVFMSVIALRSASRHLLRQRTPWRNRDYDLWNGEDVAGCGMAAAPVGAAMAAYAMPAGARANAEPRGGVPAWPPPEGFVAAADSGVAADDDDDALPLGGRLATPEESPETPAAAVDSNAVVDPGEATAVAPASRKRSAGKPRSRRGTEADSAPATPGE